MVVIFDLSVLHSMGDLKAMYSVKLDKDHCTVNECFVALSEQHQQVFKTLESANIVDGEKINAMLISGQDLLKLNSIINDGQSIKVIGQICGG